MPNVSSGQRVIAHVDMDAFYASIEQRDHPELRGKPVAVGGNRKRGVVAAASYEARKFGVHSAMPGGKAAQLCPQLVFVSPRMSHYRRVSSQAFAIFQRYTPIVEGLSLDEAFLDITGSLKLLGPPTAIAHSIKKTIREELGLVASVGIAENKFLAKLASDINKPDGLLVVAHGKAQDFLDPLPVSRLWGVGRKTRVLLEDSGVRTIGALRMSPVEKVSAMVGRAQAQHFLALARGLDSRPVVPGRAEKSISHEETFSEDLRDIADIHSELLDLSMRVAARARKLGVQGETIVVKVRTGRFETFTRSRTLNHATDRGRDIYHVARDLFDGWYKGRGHGLRLLGVGVSRLIAAGQNDLFATVSGSALDRLADSVAERFGERSLIPARLLGKYPREND